MVRATPNSHKLLQGRKATKPKNVPCDWSGCHKAFNRRADMVRHIKGVHQGIKPLKCKFVGCHKRFSQSTSLKQHMNVHTGAKPHICEHCGRRFADSSSCTRHMREQHMGMKYFCAWCTTSNKRASEFRKHLRIEHKLPNTEEMDIMPFLLPKEFTVDDLEKISLFHGRGMTGLEMRRKTPEGRKAARVASSAHMLSNPALICMPVSRSSSLDSLASTPALSPSVSPAPSSAGSVESYSTEPSHFALGENALGVHFGIETQGVYLSPLSTFSPSLGAVTESTDSYGSHCIGYAPPNSDQEFYAEGYDKSYMDTQMPIAVPFAGFGYDLYDNNDMTVDMPHAQHQGFQPESHMNYVTPPISHYGRASHAQVSGWGTLP